MAKRFHGNFLRLLMASGWLMLTTGCDLTTNGALQSGLPASSSDVILFIEQFAREALAAFLF